MRRPIPLFLACLAAAPTLARAEQAAVARAEQAGPRRISLQEAIKLAVDDSLEVAVADEGVDAARARVKGVKAQRLPRIQLLGNLIYWDEQITASFAPPGAPPGPSLVVREQITASATVTAAQPLSALLVIGSLIDLEEAGLGAAGAKLDRAKLDAGARAAESYVRLLQAGAARDVAVKGVAQVEANLDRVRKLRAAGAAGDLDVLRLEAGRDAAKQFVLRSDAQLEIASRGLVLTLNLPTGTALEVTDDLPDPPPPPPLGPEEAAAQALKRRPELHSARERVTQASKGQTVAKASLLPNILAVGQFQHTEGMGPFQPADSWFVGLTLQWDVWDWGKNFAAVNEAAARKRQAKIGERALTDQVAFDARRRALDAQSSYESVAVAKSALTAAEEAYRLQTIRNEQGVSTTTEVLDAETEVLRARTTWVLSRYEYFLSLVALMRSVGDLPSAPAPSAP